MVKLHRAGWVTAFSVGLACVVSACNGGSEDAELAHGVIVSIDVDARRVTLDHGDIPGLMKAMTMGYDVARGVALDGLRPGVEVDFRVKYAAGVYTVTEIRRANSGAE